MVGGRVAYFVLMKPVGHLKVHGTLDDVLRAAMSNPRPPKKKAPKKKAAKRKR